VGDDHAQSFREQLGSFLGPDEAVEMAVEGSLTKVLNPIAEAAKALGAGAVSAALTGGFIEATRGPSLVPVVAVLTTQRLILVRRALVKGSRNVVGALPRRETTLVQSRGINIAPSYFIADLQGARLATLSFPAWRRSEARALAEKMGSPN